MKPLIVSYGEALVDFLPDRAGVPLRDVETFRKTIGGAPANVAVGIARLGCPVALMGKVGDDEFGHFLRLQLGEEGVDVEGLLHTRAAKTGITFISLTAGGDRSFLFFREPSADMTIRVPDIDTALIERSTIFVAGSNLLTAPAVREATYHALEHARRSDRFVVLDPNVRLHLWPPDQSPLDHVRRELSYGDIVKLNEEELQFLRDDQDAAALWAELREEGLSALIITRAEAGATVYWTRGTLSIPAPSCTVVDTTGAGDGFVAGLVCGLLRGLDTDDPRELRERVRAFDADDWKPILSLACWVGSRVCLGLGATPALPREEMVPWNELGF